MSYFGSGNNTEPEAATHKGAFRHKFMRCTEILFSDARSKLYIYTY